MEQERAIESDQLDVLVVQERDTMLRLLARCVSVDCDRTDLKQRLGGRVPCERMVHSRIHALRADRTSISQVLLM
jgi:hypothetical protein